MRGGQMVVKVLNLAREKDVSRYVCLTSCTLTGSKTLMQRVYTSFSNTA